MTEKKDIKIQAPVAKIAGNTPKKSTKKEAQKLILIKQEK